jgi:bifunctional DNA-binding transcriptional regulator/antitoxin component of YhaV-PrlF toxin-antitoxin module
MIKKKYQVVIPQRVRQQIGVRVGDLLEAQAYKGKIVFTPKSMVDRALAEGLDDLEKGRVHGPFASAAETLASLQGKGRKSVRRIKSHIRRSGS